MLFEGRTSYCHSICKYVLLSSCTRTSCCEESKVFGNERGICIGTLKIPSANHHGYGRVAVHTYAFLGAGESEGVGERRWMTPDRRAMEDVRSIVGDEKSRVWHNQKFMAY